jgi:GntR family transcriptional regulator, transcriptional repressor for pyruvate dehydrogenase complex
MESSAAKVSLEPAARRKLSETVAEQLMEAFRDLPPGTKVPSERELTQDLGVGRSTVREALNGLAVLGILTIRHGQGAFIADGPPRDTRDASSDSLLTTALERGVTREYIEARLLVEVEVTRLAAQRRTDEDLQRIEAALATQERSLAAGEIDSTLRVATSFNVLLAEAAHNEVLSAMVQVFVELMKERGPKLYALTGFGDWDLREHRGIYEAVRDQDGDRAAKLMREHILQLAERYREAGAA